MTVDNELTICVGTYRGPDHLTRALQSLRNGGWKGRVIVGDDGTNVRNREINVGIVSEAVSIAAETGYHDADLILSSKNTGWPANFNRMTSLVRTPYVLFLDNDAIYPKGLAELAVSLLKALPHAGMLSWVSRNVTVEEAGKLCVGYEPDEEGRYQLPDHDTELAAFCSAYHVAALRRMDGFDEAFRYYFADSDLAVRLAIDGKPSFRIQWPRIPHVEHSTIHVFPELNGDVGREMDRMRFYKKWERTGPEIRDVVCQGLGRPVDEINRIAGIVAAHEVSNG
jgi:GT2 family glycosyltransferase